MSELPIPFSAPMVRALLREIEAPGTGKTQTRRASKWQPRPCGGKIPGAIYSNDYYWPISEGFGTVSNKPYPPESWLKVHGPRYAVGDRLYVREHWRAPLHVDDQPPREIPPTNSVHYCADGAAPTIFGRHRRAMHMPRWASRITLLVTEVRVERLQDCSRADALAEGVEMETADPPFYYVPGIWPHSLTAVGIEEPGGRWAERSYAKLWDYINGPGAWALNPWVAAYSFRPILGNIDRIGEAA